jgi:hypothetical protein
VAVSRLEALEADRWEALPRPCLRTHLAHTVCRALETDPSTVLAGLPAATRHVLDVSMRACTNLSRAHGTLACRTFGMPVARVVAALAAAAVLAWIVVGTSAVSRIRRWWTPRRQGRGARARRGLGGDGRGARSRPVPPGAMPCGFGTGLGRVLGGDRRPGTGGRLAHPGRRRVLDVDAALPLRLTLGNARTVDVLLRGQPVDLGAHTNDNNVARLELR